MPDRFVLYKKHFVEQVKDKTAPRRRNRKQIEQILKDFEQSGIPAKEFCLIHQIHPSNFHKWKSRYKSKAPKKARSSSFASLDIIDPAPAFISSLFCEVKGIKIYQPVSATFLKELIK
jgi:hypothetical protein